MVEADSDQLCLPAISISILQHFVLSCLNLTPETCTALLSKDETKVHVWADHQTTEVRVRLFGDV